MTCFICGREYDPEHKETAVQVSDVNTGEIYDVRTIRVWTGHNLKLCKYCVKAATYAFVLSNLPGGKVKLLDKMEYEDEAEPEELWLDYRTWR